MFCELSIELIFDHAASTRTHLSSGLTSRILFMCRETSTTTPSVNDCPLVPVPPPRGARVTPANPVGNRLCDANDVVDVTGENGGLRQRLVDRIIGRQDNSIRHGRRNIALECACAQLGNERKIERHISLGGRSGAEASFPPFGLSFIPRDSDAVERQQKKCNAVVKSTTLVKTYV